MWIEPRLRLEIATTGLLLIDMQVGFNDPEWGPRNNPALETNVGALLATWRQAGAPVFHAHHDSPAAAGRLRRFTSGGTVMPLARPLKSEPIHHKRVNSAFIGTGLETDLLARGIEVLVVAGLTTNHCISSTARMARNLGFRTLVVADATASFAQTHVDGRPRPADEVHDAALSDLMDEFAEIVTTQAVTSVLSARKAAACA